MNYWHGDYALSRAALELAKVSGADSPPHMANISYSADAATLLASSKNWIKLLDPKTGHFRVKNSNGSFLNTFDEFAWGPEVCSENKLVTVGSLIPFCQRSLVTPKLGRGNIELKCRMTRAVYKRL